MQPSSTATPSSIGTSLGNVEQPPVPAHIQRRQLKELEEYRKVGLASPAVDIVTGQEISPHIPSHLATAPWYLKEFQKNTSDSSFGGSGRALGGGGGGLTLAHHRVEKTDDSVFKEDFEQALVAVNNNVLSVQQPTSNSSNSNSVSSSSSMVLGAHGSDMGTASQRVTKYRPGACTNCGSLSHKASSCIKPKRKVGALYTNKIDGKDFITVKKTDLLAIGEKGDLGAGGISSSVASRLLISSSAAQQQPQELTYEQKKASWSKKELCFQKSEEIHKATQKKLKDAASFEAMRREETAADQKRLANSKLPKQQYKESYISVKSSADVPSSSSSSLLSLPLSSDINIYNNSKKESLFAGQTSEFTTSTNSDLAFLPKYLENIDEENAYYDPRSRSFRGNPNANKTSYKNMMTLMNNNNNNNSNLTPSSVMVGLDHAATSAANTYKGDNARTRTEGYYSYMEQVSSFAKGETRSFANLRLHEEADAVSRLEQEKLRNAVRKAELTQRALYGAVGQSSEGSLSCVSNNNNNNNTEVLSSECPVVSVEHTVGVKRDRVYAAHDNST